MYIPPAEKCKHMLKVQVSVKSGGILKFFVFTVVLSFLLEKLAALSVDMEETQPWTQSYRIPSGIYPTHYKIQLFPNLKQNTFEGTCEVFINLNISVEHLFVPLHVKNLNIEKTVVYDHGIEEWKEISPSTEPFEYTKHEFWVIPFLKSELVGKGKIRVVLKFNGRLDNGIVGFYKSVYSVERDGRSKSYSLATTKFQPTYARRAFPCFDEPSFKSTFDISLVRPTSEGFIALSNMPIEEEIVETPMPGFTTVKFEKSPPMVTYLVIMIVSQFEFISPKSNSSSDHSLPDMKVYGSQNQIQHLQFSLDVCQKVTKYYQDYFGMKYPLPKLDMAAIPDYSSGATEHWGLITYREANLVYDEESSSTYNLIRVSEVIAHELAHQWFGNLVTLQWWNDLWLNEGFAVYMSYKGLKHLYPSWDTETMFVGSVLHPVLDFDSTSATHPIVVEKCISTPDDINAVFDKISYSKGASVIRMLEQFIRPKNFRLALTKFLTRFSMRNAVTHDLLTEIDSVLSSTDDDHQQAATILPTNVSIFDIMERWTNNKGYPIVFVEKKIEVDSEPFRQAVKYRVSQKSIFDNDESTLQSTSDNKWYIPIMYGDTGEKLTEKKINGQPREEDKIVWLNADTSYIDIEIDHSGGDSPFTTFNSGCIGYYRTFYTPLTIWNTLQLKYMSDVNKICLLNDAFYFAKSSKFKLPFEVPLNLILQLIQNENCKLKKDVLPTPSYEFWDAVWDELRYLDRILEELPSVQGDDDNRTNLIHLKLRKFQLKLIESHQELIQWPTYANNETSDSTKWSSRLSALFVKETCRLDNEYALKQMRNLLIKYYKQEMKGSGAKTDFIEIEPDWRSIVYGCGMKAMSPKFNDNTGDEDENITETEMWTFLLEKYISEKNAQERSKILSGGLSHAVSSSLLHRLIHEIGQDERVIRQQDFFSLLSSISLSGPLGQKMVWDYVSSLSGWDQIVQRFTINDRYFGNLLPLITKSFSSESKLHDMERLFAERPEAGAGKQYRTFALENVKRNIDLLNENLDDIENWLNKHEMYF